MIADIFRAVIAAGLLSFVGCMLTAISSRSRYEDALPVFLFYLSIFLLVIGGMGLLVAGVA